MSSEQFFALWNATSLRWTWTLMHFLWQGLAIGLVAAMAMIVLRQASSQLRYTLLVALLVLMAICPIATFCYLAETNVPMVAAIDAPATSTTDNELTIPAADIEAALMPTTSEPVLAENELVPTESAPDPVEPEAALAVEPIASQLPASTIIEPQQPALEPIAQPFPWHRVAKLATCFYIAIVALFLLRLALGLHGGGRLCRTATRVTDPTLLDLLAKQTKSLGLRTSPALAYCRDVTVPTVVGVLRPTILLPLCCLSGMAVEELEVILAHELAHVRRYDHVVNLLQRLVESFLFFHPAVWWLSRQIRIEREHCCDDLVVALGAKPLTYAASLLHVAELSHGAQSRRAAVVGVGATGKASHLRRRIIRLLGAEHHPPVRLMRAWPLVLMLGLALLVAVTAFVPRSEAEHQPESTAQKDVEADPFSQIDNDVPAEPTKSENSDSPIDEPKSEAQDDHWGLVSDGLQAKLTVVDPRSNDLAVFSDKGTVKFTRPEDVTLYYEIKNVSDKPISVLLPGDIDKGKFSDQIAPLLFNCEITDSDGKAIDAPSKKMSATDAAMRLSNGRPQILAPSKSVGVLLRPGHWNAALARAWESGAYYPQVLYRGPASEVLRELKRIAPDSIVFDAWTGELEAPAPRLILARDATHDPPGPVWGQDYKGLRAAIELRDSASSDQGRENTASATFPFGSVIDVGVLVQNTSDKPVSLWSETWRYDKMGWYNEEVDTLQNIGHSWYTGLSIMEQWTLKPGQIAVLNGMNMDIDVAGGTANAKHALGRTFYAKPGKYSLKYQLIIGEAERRDKNGRKIIPGEDDWVGNLETGSAQIIVGEKEPAPDEAATEKHGNSNLAAPRRLVPFAKARRQLEELWNQDIDQATSEKIDKALNEIMNSRPTGDRARVAEAKRQLAELFNQDTDPTISEKISKVVDEIINDDFHEDSAQDNTEQPPLADATSRKVNNAEPPAHSDQADAARSISEQITDPTTSSSDGTTQNQESENLGTWNTSRLTKVEAVHPVARRVTNFADSLGRVKPSKSVQVRSPLGGYLKSIEFPEGGTVKRGQVLFTTDDRRYRAELKRAEANVERATYRTRRAESGTGELTSADAEAELQAAKAELEIAKLNLENTRLIAPLDGRIGAPQVDEGNLIKANETVLATLIALAPVSVSFGISNDTYVRLQKAIRDGKLDRAKIPVHLWLNGDREHQFETTMNFVVGEINPVTHTPENITIPLKNSDTDYMPGIPMMVRVETSGPHDAILVEQLYLHGIGNRFAMVVDTENIVRYRAVELGQFQDDGKFIVTKGLEREDWVITKKVNQDDPGLTEGQKVEVTRIEASPETAPSTSSNQTP